MGVSTTTTTNKANNSVNMSNQNAANSVSIGGNIGGGNSQSP
eukprot:CAMPEP_0170492754 /NCGR_PEP_ID=MMETSP0208-20121228/12798_1 /TAXON_ID=197538 /ORGANISM="Strombidium inclinatum, Strain S3" /LENGTH=41 /DNA_ID= /DNA_START= /DNA_END= /DNA_ORIENTATION=